MRAPIRIVTLVLALLTMQAPSASSYDPPPASSALLRGIDFTSATPLDEDYRREFQGCDGVLGAARKDRFRGFRLSGDYRCSTDPSRVKTLLMARSTGKASWRSISMDRGHRGAAQSGGVQMAGRSRRPICAAHRSSGNHMVAMIATIRRHKSIRTSIPSSSFRLRASDALPGVNRPRSAANSATRLAST